jgi:hypothetical protein
MKTPSVPVNAAVGEAGSCISARAISQPCDAQKRPFSISRTTARTGRRSASRARRPKKGGLVRMIRVVVEHRSAERAGGLRLVCTHSSEKFAPDQVLGASAKHHCLVPHRVGRFPMQSLQTGSGLERTTIVAGNQADLRACPQKAKCHGGLDAASVGELLSGMATVPEMFRKAERRSDRQNLCPHEPGCLRVEPIEIFFSYFHKCFSHARMRGRGRVMPSIDRDYAGSASVD